MEALKSLINEYLSIKYGGFNAKSVEWMPEK